MDQGRRALIEAHLPLVEHVVLKVAGSFPRFVDRNDLVAAGMLGLVEAAQRFDDSRSVPFAGFATQRIRGAVIDVARSADWAPRTVREQARRVDDATSHLATRAKGRPDDSDIAAATGMTVDELRRLRERVEYGVLRALDYNPSGDGLDASQLVTDRGAMGPDEVLEAEELRGYLRSALHHLPERHRTVIVGIFFENRSFDELAELLGVTPSRISQLRSDALEMLRDGLESQFDATGDGPATESATPPKGRVAIRKARFSSEIAAYADWRTRLTPNGVPLPIVSPPQPAAVGFDS